VVRLQRVGRPAGRLELEGDKKAGAAQKEVRHAAQADLLDFEKVRVR
jgi:hypothetical protein